MHIEYEKDEAGFSLKEFNNKLYIDPQFGIEQYSSTVNYAVFTNCWQIEDVKEDFSIRIVHPESGDSILLSFNTFKDKLAFAQSIYSSREIKQIGKGHDLESLANLNLLHKSQNGRERNTLITAFDVLRLIAEKYIFPKLSIEGFFKRIRSAFKKGQFASWL